MSVLNDLVGKAIKESAYFKFHKIKAEYPLNSINPDWKSKKEKVDWAILSWGIAIEVDGEHHSKPTRYGGISEGEAEDKFVSQVRRDDYKNFYCHEAGWQLIRISYLERLKTEDEIIDFILDEVVNGAG